MLSAYDLQNDYTLRVSDVSLSIGPNSDSCSKLHFKFYVGDNISDYSNLTLNQCNFGLKTSEKKFECKTIKFIHKIINGDGT